MWHTPRRTWLRWAIFQVHLWTGVGIGLYAAVIGLTGSALVFRAEIESALAPQMFKPGAVTSPLPLDALMAHALKGHEGQHVMGINGLEDPNGPAIIYLKPASLKPSDVAEHRLVYVHRGTGEILGSRLRDGGFFGFCENLHVYLLAGERGYLANGILAIVFLALCLSGWVVWWPGIKSLARSVRIHWRAGWRRLNWDLHSVSGFWSNPALIVVVATGVFFVFPQPFLVALAKVSGGGVADVRAWFTTPESQPAKPGTPPVNAQSALLAAQNATPSGMQITYFAIPEAPNGVFQAIAYRPHTAPYAQPVFVYVDQYSGKVAGIHDARNLPWGMRLATYVYAVHFGSFAGMVSKVLWFLLGLLPTGLLITGLVMWWNRSLRRTWKKFRYT